MLGSSLVLACAVLWATGCRNNAAQSDLIQREMRHQEDQIYALQDYLSEYQQLLCEARTENEALRQQLARDQFRGGSPAREKFPPPPATPPKPNGQPQPEIQIKDDIEMTLPEVPPTEPDIPEPPPLGPMSRDEQVRDDPRIALAVYDEADEPPAAPAEVAASYEEPVATPSVAFPAIANDCPPVAVAVRAEVSQAGGANGPRVLVDVLPLDEDGGPATCDGQLSLLFRDPAAIGNARDLARWDFTSDELADFAHDTSQGTTYVFPLQLPADAPADRPVEMWVRLVPEDGEKVLTRAELDLSRPGRFVFDERLRPKRVDYSVRTASAVAPIAPSLATGAAPSTVTSVDGWQIARPGDLPVPTSSPPRHEGTWRTATQPIPVVESRPAAIDPLDRYASSPFTLDDMPTERIANAAPQWLPERPRSDSSPIEDKVAPPRWSATR